MSQLIHEGQIISTVNSSWQTRARGTNQNEYEIYCACAGDGKGNDSTTGEPLKTFDEWLNS